MNLAEIPLGLLTRRPPQKKKDASGKDIIEQVFHRTIYDSVSRRRIPQTITLRTASPLGLPQPSDNDALVAFFSLSKTINDYSSPRTEFVPNQLFNLMRWSNNSRSYQRLDQVFERLTSVKLTLENAWYDASGREYKRRLHTGILAEAELYQPKKNPASSLKSSYFHWAPHIYESLAKGHIKKLDVDVFFSLKLPTSRNMYRFLDKRFYTDPVFEMDLIEFACGYIGVTEAKDVGQLKYRLSPAIAELERIGFIAPISPPARYQKVKKGIWRVRLESAVKRPASVHERAENFSSPSLEGPEHPTDSTPAARIVSDFYALHAPTLRPSELALDQAQVLINTHGLELVTALLPQAVRRLEINWPKGKHFGALLSFFAELADEHKDRQQHQQRLEEQKRQQQQEREAAAETAAADKAFTARWQPIWDALSEPDREAIRAVVLKANPGYASSPKLRNSFIVTQLYLRELARHYSEHPQNDLADEPPTAK